MPQISPPPPTPPEGKGSDERGGGDREGGEIFNEKEDTEKERQNIDLDYFIIPPKTPPPTKIQN